MAERSLRGMSIGAKSLESDDNVDFAARNDVAYVCPKGHRTILPFAEGAEIPDEWECRCGSVAHREGDDDVRPMRSPSRPVRTGTCCWSVVARRSSPRCSRSVCRCTATVGFPITSEPTTRELDAQSNRLGIIIAEAILRT